MKNDLDVGIFSKRCSLTWKWQHWYFAVLVCFLRGLWQKTIIKLIHKRKDGNYLGRVMLYATWELCDAYGGLGSKPLMQSAAGLQSRSRWFFLVESESEKYNKLESESAILPSVSMQGAGVDEFWVELEPEKYSKLESESEKYSKLESESELDLMSTDSATLICRIVLLNMCTQVISQRLAGKSWIPKVW